MVHGYPLYVLIKSDNYFNNLIKAPCLGNIYFDDVGKISQKYHGNISEKYDLIMTNDNTIGIVEINYKADENDLAKLERKIKNFKLLFPNYQNYKIYGALAIFHINDDAKQTVLNHGFFVLQRSGEIIHTESSPQLKVY